MEYIDTGKKRQLFRNVADYCLPVKNVGDILYLGLYAFLGQYDGSGHEWNCLLTSESEIPFMGLEANPDGPYSPQNLILQPDANKSTFRLAPKVFRKTFSVNSLIKNNDPVAPYPQHFTDVTDKYCKVGEITISTDANDSVFSYVCVYNKKTWHPVDFGIIHRERMAFKNLAVNLLYLPCVFRVGQLIPASSPIILDENGGNILLNPALSTENIQINNLYSIPMEQLKVINEIGWSDKWFLKKTKDIAYDIKRIKPTNGVKYLLEYWRDDWVYHSFAIASNSKLIFRNCPKHALFRLRTEDNSYTSRPFTFEKSQSWW